MLGEILKNLVPLKRVRRKQDLERLRRQFEQGGYGAERLHDSELEAAIARYCGPIEDPLPLTGRRINWILRSLAPDAEKRTRAASGSKTSEHPQ